MTEIYSQYRRENNEVGDKESGVPEMAFVGFLAGHPEILGVEVAPPVQKPFVDLISTPYKYGEKSDTPNVERALLTQLWSRDMYGRGTIKDGTEPDDDD